MKTKQRSLYHQNLCKQNITGLDLDETRSKGRGTRSGRFEVNKTSINPRSINPDLLVKRCKCGKAIEDKAHILNSCELNHKLIIQRHDHLVRKIAKELKRGNPTAILWIERHWRLELQLVKPDITMIDKGHCTIMELTCPYETNVTYRDQRAEGKIEKYKALLKDLKQVNCLVKSSVW